MKLFEMTFGSHLYGTNTPASDTDLKAIYIPSAREILLGRARETILQVRPKGMCERNTKDDVDEEIFSFQRYFTLLTQGQTVALDMLFAPEEFIRYGKDPWGRALWKEIRQNKHNFLHRDISPFIGYARQQAAKYGVKGSRLEILGRAITALSKLPPYDELNQHHGALGQLIEGSKEFVSLERQPLIEIVMWESSSQKDLKAHLSICNRKIPLTANVKYALSILTKIHDGYGERARKAHLAGGVDWKALSHAVRVNSQGVELLQTGNITFPRPDRDLLKAIKTGQMTFEEVSEIITNGLLMLESAVELSALPDVPNYAYIDGLICDTYGRVVHASCFNPAVTDVRF